MKKIHIQISYNTSQQLLKTKEKYHVSFSTIADVLLNVVYLEIIPNNEFLDKGNKNQTTILLNQQNKEQFMDKLHLTQNDLVKIISNLFYLYANDFKESKLNKEQIIKYKSKIGNELSQKRDKYYNYNQTYRNLIRARKQYNKEYGEK